MCRFFQPIAKATRSIIQGAGVACTGAAVGYITNRAMVSLFQEVKTQIRPYVPAEWAENDNEKVTSQPVMIRNSSPK